MNFVPSATIFITDMIQWLAVFNFSCCYIRVIIVDVVNIIIVIITSLRWFAFLQCWVKVPHLDNQTTQSQIWSYFHSQIWRKLASGLGLSFTVIYQVYNSFGKYRICCCSSGGSRIFLLRNRFDGAPCKLS